MTAPRTARTPRAALTAAPASMLHLTAVRLINWYHFPDITFTMQGSTLLLGDNGSGKSTVLDAIQLALVADLSEVRFNKAANEKSSRSVYTYVRGKLGAESSTDARYTRGSCTAFVLLEFTHTDPARAASPGGRFVAGIAMDVLESDTEVRKSFVIVPDVGVAEMPVLAPAPGGMFHVRTSKDFRTHVRAMGGEFMTDAASYRGKLRQRLGPVPDSFHRLIAKGLEFKPMGHIRDFVMNYLAEPVAIQTGPLLANLDHYKSMEQEAAAAETRIALLDGLCEKGLRVQENARLLRTHEYMALRAGQEVAEAEQETIEVEIDQAHRTFLAKSQAVERLEERLKMLEQRRASLQESLAKHDVFQAKRHAEEELDRTRDSILIAKDAAAKAREILEFQTQALDRLLSEDARAVRAAWSDENDGAGIVPADALFGSSEPPERVALLREVLVSDGSLAGHDLRAWSDRLRAARKQVQEAGFRLTTVHATLTKEDRDLRSELAQIDAGRVQYPPATEALLFLLKSKLQSPRRAPQPICELLEVKNERWRDAIEAMLGQKRFDILVAPEDYQRVSSLYELHRRGVDMGRRGQVELGGVGVIDIGRIVDRGSRVEARSLAEQVEASDPLVRAYIAYALGNVICCEDVKELRQHRSAVTPTVMIYQGYTVRHPNERSYRPGVIGVAARAQRRGEIDTQLSEIAESKTGLEHDQIILQRVDSACEKAIIQVERFPDFVDVASALPHLQRTEGEIVRRLRTLDVSDIAELSGHLEEAKAAILGTRGEHTEATGDRERYHERRKNLLEKSEKTFAAVERATAAFEAAFPVDPPRMYEAFEELYIAERAKPRTAAAILDGFGIAKKASGTKVDNARQELIVAKTTFNNKYGDVGLATGDDYDDYRRERDEWVDSRLPEFRDRMQFAREQATEQLANHVVSQLGESFNKMERGFAELNRALREVSFGADKYQFTNVPDPEMRVFYDLIKEASKFPVGAGSLFADQALPPQLRETLDGMVSRLLQQGPNAAKSDLEKMTDYREYYRYDIIISKPDGTRSSYEAVSGDNSGGETQTPYYIAILASMLQMYRTLHADRRPRCGLVLLDEAFSKMDGGRIAATLKFVKELGLQIILATPKEKVDAVARHVGTCIFIDKDPTTGVPSVVEFERQNDDSDGEALERNIEETEEAEAAAGTSVAIPSHASIALAERKETAPA